MNNSFLHGQFQNYLIKQGYKQHGDNNSPSTVYNYMNSVAKIAERECCSYDSLANDVENIVAKYSKVGAEAEFGSKSNDTNINALKQFLNFVEQIRSIFQ